MQTLTRVAGSQTAGPGRGQRVSLKNREGSFHRGLPGSAAHSGARRPPTTALPARTLCSREADTGCAAARKRRRGAWDCAPGKRGRRGKRHTHRQGAPKSWPGRSAGFRRHPSPALGLPCRKGPAPWAAPSRHPAARGKAELASPDVHGLAQARLSTSRLAQDGVRRRRGPSPRLLRVCSCPGQPFLCSVGTLCPGSRGMLPAWLRVGIWPLLPALGPDTLQDHVPAPEHTICSNKHPLVF